MEAKVSEILENVLSLLSLEGSFDVEEKDDGVFVSIDTADAGRLIGHNGETLTALQLLVNLIVYNSFGRAVKTTNNEAVESSAYKQVEEPKRVIVDVSNWKKGKEEDIAQKAKRWAEEVKESGKPMELEPMPSWQRRVVHMIIQETDGVSSESVGEGMDRHLVISPQKAP